MVHLGVQVIMEPMVRQVPQVLTDNQAPRDSQDLKVRLELPANPVTMAFTALPVREDPKVTQVQPVLLVMLVQLVLRANKALRDIQVNKDQADHKATLALQEAMGSLDLKVKLALLDPKVNLVKKDQKETLEVPVLKDQKEQKETKELLALKDPRALLVAAE